MNPSDLPKRFGEALKNAGYMTGKTDKFVEKLDKTETYRLEGLMIRNFVKVITSHPKSAEAAAAALSALVHCAYQLGKRMWGTDEAVKSIKFALEWEAQKDKENKN